MSYMCPTCGKQEKMLTTLREELAAERRKANAREQAEHEAVDGRLKAEDRADKLSAEKAALQESALSSWAAQNDAERRASEYKLRAEQVEARISTPSTSRREKERQRDEAKAEAFEEAAKYLDGMADAAFEKSPSPVALKCDGLRFGASRLRDLAKSIRSDSEGGNGEA